MNLKKGTKVVLHDRIHEQFELILKGWGSLFGKQQWLVEPMFPNTTEEWRAAHTFYITEANVKRVIR